MKQEVLLTAEHVDKFTSVSAGDRRIPVKIIFVGGGLCGWSVLDQNMPLRSGKMRYDETKAINIYDTVEEVMDEVKE